MKKITFLLFSLIGFLASAQVNIDENFEAGMPGDWSATYSTSTSFSCDGTSARVNLYGSNTSANLTTSNQVGSSNGTDLDVSFDYKIVDYDDSTFGASDNPTPAGWGTAELQYSTDDGANWVTALTIDDGNHTASSTCATMMVTVPAASLPNGSDVKLQIINTWAAGDYYFYVDNFVAMQAAVNPPNCDATLADITSAGDISWTAATGIPTGYTITAGTTSGGNDLADNVDAGDVLTYNVGALSPGDVVYVTIVPYNDNGPATGCVEQSMAVPCLDPSGGNATNIGINQADLNWTENGTAALYNVEVVFAGDAPTGTATDSGVANGFTKMGLTSFTDYEFYVQADCTGGSLSGWVGPFAFTTLCSALVPDYTADMSVNVPDSCWNEAGSGDTTTGPMDLGASDWRQGTSYALGSSNAINLYSNVDQEWLLSPVFDLSVAGPYQLELNVAVTNWNNGTQDDTMGSDDEVQLLMSTDGGASWSNLTTWNAGNEPPVGGIEYVEDLTAITGNVQFAIYATDGAVDDSEDYDFHVGKFRVREIPSCPDPASLMMTSLTDMTADFSWSVAGTETTWEYANLPSPSAEPASGTSTMATSVGFTDLTPETDYDFYIRVDCGGTYSSWAMISYTTPATPPVNNDCANAITLTPGGTFDDNPITGQTNAGATGSGELPLPGCASYDPADGSGNGGDVWYAVTVPSDGNLTIETDADPTGNGGDGGMAVYTGSCGSLTLFECDDDDGNGLYGQVIIDPADGLADQTVYLRVWEYGGDAIINFQVSAFSATLSSASFEDEAAFTYYPNPVKNTLRLNAQNTIENVTMYNMLGQEVLRATPNTVNSELDMSSLQDGTYFVKVTIANITKTVRVIKQ